MSKRSRIRWTSADEQELRRVVKNFNAKISRLEKKNPHEKDALPERVTVRQIRELITTRQDLRRELNALQRFSRRGAEELVPVPSNKYNLQITRWQRTEMQRRAGVINRRRKKRLNEIIDIEAESRGEKLGYTIGDIGMGKAEELSLSPVKAFTPSMSRKDLKKKDSMLHKESQDGYWNKREQLLKSTYIKSLETNFSADDVADIIEAIDRMDFAEFYRIFKANGGSAIFEFSSDIPSESARQDSLIWLRSTWLPNKQPKKTSKKKKGGK